MAEWNLSVELRGQGNNLARKLREAASEARLLSDAASDAQDQVGQLGTTSTTTAKAVKKLGTSSQTATRRLLAMAAEAKAAAKDFRTLERALKRTDEQVRAMANSVRITAELDDQTGPGITAINTALAALRALSPVNLTADLDDQTATGLAGVRTAVADLHALSPVRLTADLDDQTATGVAAVRTAVAELRALSPVSLTADLDDQTATGLAGVRAAVADLHLLSPVNLTADLDDRTATGVAGVRAAVNDLQRLSPVDLTVNFTGNSADITAAAAAMGDLRDRADSAQTALADLTTQAAAAAPALNLLQQEAQDLSRALRTLRGRAAAAADALDDLNARAVAAATGIRTLGTGARTANGHLTTLSGNTRTLRGDLDDLDGSLTRVTGRMGGLRGSLGTVSSSSNNASDNSNNLKQALVGLATALIPIAAAVVPIAAGMAAAGVAVGAFGVAVAGQIVALTDAADAEEKYEKAVREHGKTSTEAAAAEKEYLRIVSEMPPATREAAAGLGVLKDQYKEWSNALAGDTMPVVTKSMGLFGAMLPHLTPLVKGTSKELDRLLNVAAGGMSTPGFDRFVASFTRFANESLARGTTGLIKFTQALDTGKIGNNLQEFLDYARANGPLVADTLGNLAQAVVHLLVAASDMGVSVLTAVNALAKLVNAVPASVLSLFLQLYAALKLVTLGAAALGAVTGSAAIARLGAYFAVLRAAGVATTLRATAASMSMMTKAAIGLGVLAVAAVGISKLADKARGAPPDVDRLTTSLKELAVTGKMTGEFKKTFGDIDGVVKKMGELGKAAKDNDEYVKSFGNSGFGPLDDLRKKANDLWQDFTKGDKSITALKDDFSGLDEAMAGMVSSGYGKQAASDFARIQAAAKKAGYSTKEIAEFFPQYQDALAAAAAEQKLAAAGMGVFGEQAMATKTKLDAQKQSADGLRASIIALNAVNRSAYDSQIAFEAGLDDLTASFKENGNTLDLNTKGGRANGQAMSQAAAAQDEMIASGLAAGESLKSMTGKSEKLRTTMMALATDAFDGNKTKAQEYVNTLLGTPDEIKTIIKLERQEAITGLQAVQAAIKATPGAKSVKVDTLNAAAIAALEAVGLKTRQLPDGRTEVYTANGQSLASVGAVWRALNALDGKTANTYTNNYITTIRRTKAENNTIGRPASGEGGESKYADGGVVDYYANGGIQRGGVQHFAGGSENHVAQIARAGSWRVWGEPETMGEGYVPFAPSKRPRSRRITEEIVRRLGGNPNAIQWNAQGSVTDWRYDPTSGSLYSASDAGQAGHKTKKVKVKGGKTKEVDYFDIGAVEKKLKSAAKATRSWNKDLEKVADRLGGDVAEALAGMGADGIKLAHKMATGSKKYAEEMAKALQDLTKVAKASLTDYTRQLNKATSTDATFQKNLSTLAGLGYGDLAAQLAAQGDTAAQELAAAAVKDRKKAGAANTAAKKSNAALTSDEVQQLVAIIAAVKTPKTGIHDVADTTGLGEDEIIAIATKAQSQIKSSLGSRATKFLGDLSRANKGLSYANGGIREGIYATRGGAVTFAEPSTGGEAYIPLGPNKRAAATNVLRDVAGRFGVGLTDVSATRPVVIVQGGGDTNVNVTAVRTGATASDIGTQVGRSVRRARRGGVNARVAA
ncbi:hypothetical protein [Streptomyces sp. NPDC056227]|uniref:hypothetical protein n=1 Tax=Streptomyces sp. NPDC056227 TaxID=3345753 RepID=UPI0035D6FF4E